MKKKNNLKSQLSILLLVVSTLLVGCSKEASERDEPSITPQQVSQELESYINAMPVDLDATKADFVQVAKVIKSKVDLTVEGLQRVCEANLEGGKKRLKNLYSICLNLNKPLSSAGGI